MDEHGAGHLRVGAGQRQPAGQLPDRHPLAGAERDELRVVHVVHRYQDDTAVRVLQRLVVELAKIVDTKRILGNTNISFVY